jgi:hypothetical protein
MYVIQFILFNFSVTNNHLVVMRNLAVGVALAAC